jgi:hypothetical protein
LPGLSDITNLAIPANIGQKRKPYNPFSKKAFLSSPEYDILPSRYHKKRILSIKC